MAPAAPPVEYPTIPRGGTARRLTSPGSTPCASLPLPLAAPRRHRVRRILGGQRVHRARHLLRTRPRQPAQAVAVLDRGGGGEDGEVRGRGHSTSVGWEARRKGRRGGCPLWFSSLVLLPTRSAALDRPLASTSREHIRRGAPAGALPVAAASQRYGLSTILMYAATSVVPLFATTWRVWPAASASKPTLTGTSPVTS